MTWDNAHADAPTDDDGRPRHPETGKLICGYEKTDAVDETHGRKRDEYDYCLLAAGWGTDRSTGHCRKHNGHGAGAPEGWANPNAKHLLYSKRMKPEDRDEFESAVTTDDGGLIDVDDMADMLKRMVGFEYMRLSRAVDKMPDVKLVERWECPECGATHRNATADGICGGDKRLPSGDVVACDYTGGFELVDAEVEFGDDALQRKEAHISNLIRNYNQVTDGATVNVKGDHDVTHRGDPGAPVDVEINHVQVDLPEDEKVDPPDVAPDEDDADGGGENCD